MRRAITSPEYARRVADEFAAATQTHGLTVLHDDGLYRHLRFRRPQTIATGFDLVTWPGYLCFCGDMGEYVWSRLDDMFEFFRQPSIRPDYWAQKLQAVDARDGVSEFCPQLARRVVLELVDDYSDGIDARQATALRERVQEEILAWLDEASEDEIRQRVDEFEFDVEDSTRPFRFYDFHEYTLQRYGYRYLWACHAVRWGVEQYSQLRR